MKYNYKCIVAKNGKRYYKNVSGKWKRISNKLGEKAEMGKRKYGWGRKSRRIAPSPYESSAGGESSAGVSKKQRDYEDTHTELKNIPTEDIFREHIYDPEALGLLSQTSRGYRGLGEVIKKKEKEKLKERFSTQNDKNQALIRNIKEGNVGYVELLLDIGADVNAKNMNGNTPIHFASEEEDADVVELLLERGARVNATDKDGNTPLHFASWKGQTDVAELLLKRGADINAKDRSGNTPLYNASRKGQTDVVELLLDEGADVNAKDRSGMMLLHIASEQGHIGVVELLLERGAGVNAKDKSSGITPLHIASIYGHTKVAELLLDRGANVNAKDKKGDTPLHYVSPVPKKTEFARLLLERGADVNARNFEGNTPEDIAVKWGGRENERSFKRMERR